MFEYFKARGLVQTVADSEAGSELSIECNLLLIYNSSPNFLDFVRKYYIINIIRTLTHLNVFIGNIGFAEISTPDEWIRSGEKFMSKSLFDTAATCFRKGGDYHMEKIAKCNQKALEASRFVRNVSNYVM